MSGIKLLNCILWTGSFNTTREHVRNADSRAASPLCWIKSSGGGVSSLFEGALKVILKHHRLGDHWSSSTQGPAKAGIHTFDEVGWGRWFSFSSALPGSLKVGSDYVIPLGCFKRTEFTHGFEGIVKEIKCALEDTVEIVLRSQVGPGGAWN